MNHDLWQLALVIGGALIVRLLPGAGPILALLRPLLSRVPAPPALPPVPIPNAPALPPTIPDRPALSLLLRLLRRVPAEHAAAVREEFAAYLGVPPDDPPVS